jgi:hypothetical protein
MLALGALKTTSTVTARTKCYSIDEGSSVDCSIEDTKLQKEEKDEWGESWP